MIKGYRVFRPRFLKCRHPKRKLNWIGFSGNLYCRKCKSIVKDPNV